MARILGGNKLENLKSNTYLLVTWLDSSNIVSASDRLKELIDQSNQGSELNQEIQVRLRSIWSNLSRD